jgi:hypothetical protein
MKPLPKLRLQIFNYSFSFDIDDPLVAINLSNLVILLYFIIYSVHFGKIWVYIQYYKHRFMTVMLLSIFQKDQQYTPTLFCRNDLLLSGNLIHKVTKTRNCHAAEHRHCPTLELKCAAVKLLSSSNFPMPTKLF